MAFKKLSEKIIDWITKEPPQESIPLYDFDRLRQEVQPGDVLLIEGRSRISHIIRNITQSPWTHAALYIGRFHDIEDNHLKKIITTHLKKRENTRLVIESVIGKGTIVTPLIHYKNIHIRICRPIGLSPEDAQLVIAYMVNALGKAYNLRRVIDLARFLLPWSIFPRRWHSSLFRSPNGQIDSDICSSLIAEAFNAVQFPILPFVRPEQSGVKMIPRNAYLYTPKDFDFSPYFEIIKCPAFNLEDEQPYYRRMPWLTSAVHNDHGVITDTNTPELKKTRLFRIFKKKKNISQPKKDKNINTTTEFHPEEKINEKNENNEKKEF